MSLYVILDWCIKGHWSFNSRKEQNKKSCVVGWFSHEKAGVNLFSHTHQTKRIQDLKALILPLTDKQTPAVSPYLASKKLNPWNDRGCILSFFQDSAAIWIIRKRYVSTQELIFTQPGRTAHPLHITFSYLVHKLCFCHRIATTIILYHFFIGKKMRLSFIKRHFFVVIII